MIDDIKTFLIQTRGGALVEYGLMIAALICVCGAAVLVVNETHIQQAFAAYVKAMSGF